MRGAQRQGRRRRKRKARAWAEDPDLGGIRGAGSLHRDIEEGAVRRDREVERRASERQARLEQEMLRFVLIERRGRGPGEDKQPAVRFVERDGDRLGDVEAAGPPTQFWRVDRCGKGRRVDDHVEREQLEDAVRRALGVVAAALVVEDRNLLGRTFAPRETEFENVGLRVLRLNERVDRGDAGDVEGLLVRDQDVVPAAVDGRSGAQDHQPVLAVRVRVLADLQSAHDASPVQALVMQPDLLAEEPLLVGEVPLHQELAGEIMVADKRARLAVFATSGEIGVTVHRSFLLPRVMRCAARD